MEIRFGAYFISGVDTDSGKTYVTGRLAAHLRHRGVSVITQKPVQTGCDTVADDLVEHRKAMGTSMMPEDREGRTCTYLFHRPASPMFAAAQEGQVIDIERMYNDTRYLLTRYNVVLVEGAGGLMVPLNEKYLTIDYIVEKRLPLILVTTSKLGGINHALLSIDACYYRSIDLRCIVYNRMPGDPKDMADDQLKAIKRYALSLYPHVKVVDFRSSDSFWDAEI